MKKQKQPQKKHLFARTCRVLGRFLLVIGAVLCAASAIYALSPLLFPSTSNQAGVSSTTISDITPAPASPATPSPTAAPLNVATFIIPLILIFALLAIAIALSFRHYNKNIRSLIARIAKSTRLSIHATELILATIIWAIANLIIAFNLPVFSVITLSAMIFNNLFFIFAWTAYGCPVYTV